MTLGLVAVIVFVLQPLTYSPYFLLGCFYIGSFLGLVYILGQLLFAARFIFRNVRKK